jgi:hypothetical protein
VRGSGRALEEMDRLGTVFAVTTHLVFTASLTQAARPGARSFSLAARTRKPALIAASLRLQVCDKLFCSAERVRALLWLGQKCLRCG